MFSKVFQSALIALSTLAIAVAASLSLSLKVSGPDAVTNVDNLKLATTITNTGDQTVKVLNDPRGPMSKLPANTFAITEAKGATPSFTGIKVKYVPKVAAAAGAYTVLEPGQSVQIQHDLAHTYNFTSSGAGQYNIHAGGVLYIADDASGEVVPVHPISEAHQVNISGKLVSPRPTGSLSRRATFSGCTPAQQSQSSTAATSAQSYASSAQSYVSSHTSSTTRYAAWFGNYTASRHSTVLSHYTNITSHSISAYNFDCTCTDAGTYAYVYPDTFGTVYLCGAFWNATNTGTDSKAGTLVHESSHFTINGGTEDYVYGQPGCKSLAISTPDEAVSNADSHEYFAENNPALT